MPDLACAVSYVVDSMVTLSLLTAPLLKFSIFHKHNYSGFSQLTWNVAGDL